MIYFAMADFERAAKDLGGRLDQVPFAVSKSLNDAVQKTRQHLIAVTWPSAVTVRNKGFIRQALSIKRWATKGDLSVVLHDRLGRASLKLHAEGGTKPARGRLAIPSARVVRTASGVRQSQRPANLRRKVVKANRIFQAEGSGKRAKLRLMFTLARSARIKQDVPFYADFEKVMRAEARRAFPMMLAQAMQTARPVKRR